MHLYQCRNEIERLFGRIKRFRWVFTRYDKTDLTFTVFVTIALIADLLPEREHALEARPKPILEYAAIYRAP